MSGNEARLLRQLHARAHQAQGGLCYWCKQPMKEDAPEGDPRRLTGDYLKPLHAGGETRPGNIVAPAASATAPAIRSCGPWAAGNSARQSGTPRAGRTSIGLVLLSF
jgi:hypothetical protein